MAEDTMRNTLTVVVTATVTAALTYFGGTRPAVQHVEEDSQERHVVSCANAEFNRELIRRAAEGALPALPVPDGASAALRQFIELLNASREQSKRVVEAIAATPVECLR